MGKKEEVIKILEEVELKNSSSDNKITSSQYNYLSDLADSILKLFEQPVNLNSMNNVASIVSMSAKNSGLFGSTDFNKSQTSIYEV